MESNNTAKHFALQLGSLASLYLSLSFLLVLLFGIINLTFPDPGELQYIAESSQEMVRWGIAMVLVFFPTYLILTRVVNKLRRQEMGGTYLSLTKWLIYLSLLVGGAALLGDLVSVIMAFLNGEITQRFVLKAFAVLLVVGAAFYYYLQDARGAWLMHERESVYYGMGAALIVALVLGYGLTVIELPFTAQERNVDNRQVSDLQIIQNGIQNFYSANNRLPNSLEEVAKLTRTLPTAPADRQAYEYIPSSDRFQLCAEFKNPSKASDTTSYSYPDDTFAFANDWNHGTGRYCFERVIQNKAKTSDEAVPMEVLIKQ